MSAAEAFRSAVNETSGTPVLDVTTVQDRLGMYSYITLKDGTRVPVVLRHEHRSDPQNAGRESRKEV